jgi:uncharacterized protein (DUF1800 family)
MYNFFVADEVQVPAWKDAPPRDSEAIRILENEYFRSGYDIRSMLRVMFNSEFFKEARFQKVKSPAEVVAETLHLVGDYKLPRFGIFDTALECRYMGQDILNPPSVEGWHTGKEWIDSGSLVERVNWVADQVGDISKHGIRAIVDNLLSRDAAMTPEAVVEGCLELMGYSQLKDETRQHLVGFVRKSGEVRADNPEDRMFAEQVILRTMRMIAATREYQFG